MILMNHVTGVVVRNTEYLINSLCVRKLLFEILELNKHFLNGSGIIRK